MEIINEAGVIITQEEEEQQEWRMIMQKREGKKNKTDEWTREIKTVTTGRGAFYPYTDAVWNGPL